MFDPKIAHTQYCDYRGNVSTDIADGKDLTDLAKRLNVPEGFWPVGFDFFLSTASIDRPEVRILIYAVDSEDYGEDIDSINQKASGKGSSLRVTEFSGKIPISELFCYFKRFHVTCFDGSLQTEKMEVLKR
jgi:hypothetical protein